MKFLKKHFAKFIMAFTLAFTSLFVAFGCNTYAYTFDSNGNLVSDNLFDGDLIQGYHSGSNGNYNLSSMFVTFDGFTQVSSNTSYTISCVFSSNNSTIDGVCEYDSNGIFLDYIQIFDGVNTNSYSFITNVNAFYITINFLNNANISINDISKVMLNLGSSALPYEPFGTWYSQENYDSLVTQVDDLQNAYDSLSQDYINLKKLYNYGFFSSLESLRFTAYNSGNIVVNDSFTLQDLISDNYFSDGTFLLDRFKMSYASVTYDNAFIKFTFNPYLIASNVDMIFVGSYAFNFQFEVDFSSNEFVTYNITNDNNVITSKQLNNYSIIFNAKIASFKFSYNYNDFIPDINFNSTYANAYNTGFSDGVNSSSTTIQQLESDIGVLQNTTHTLRESLDNLIVAYNDLNASYENMLSGNNFANLFFTIAETPFASFKQIWNVDFLGVNLAGFVTGILFLGLVIWVIKKIF